MIRASEDTQRCCVRVDVGAGVGVSVGEGVGVDVDAAFFCRLVGPVPLLFFRCKLRCDTLCNERCLSSLPNDLLTM